MCSSNGQVFLGVYIWNFYLLSEWRAIQKASQYSFANIVGEEVVCKGYPFLRTKLVSRSLNLIIL